MLSDEQKNHIETVWRDLGPDAPSLYDMLSNAEAQLASQNSNPSTDEHGSEE